MKVEIEIPDYTLQTGLRLVWEPDHVIYAEMRGSALLLGVNRDGLITLARLLLTLAQPNVPLGEHVHLDSSNGLEDGSIELIIERIAGVREASGAGH